MRRGYLTRLSLQTGRVIVQIDVQVEHHGALDALHGFGLSPIFYRPGTSDAAIIQSVLVEQKEYLFPPLSPGVVFDIGANIGVVSIIMAYLWPHATIHAFEPEYKNFTLLQKNTAAYPNIVRHQVALGRETKAACVFTSDDPKNFGGFSLYPTGCDPHRNQLIEMRSIKDFMEETGAHPDVIKIDTEGAEHSILTSIPHSTLGLVWWIAGELHGNKDFETLAHLEQSGFDLKVDRSFNERCFHFHGRNKNIRWTT